MALAQRLDLRQSQSLVMTPQLQQAIKLLQMSNLELTEYVEAELERNPLLEREDGEGGAGPEADAGPVGEDDRPPEPTGFEDGEYADTLDETSRTALPEDGQAPLDADYENYWASAPAADAGPAPDGLGDWGGRGGRSDFADDERSFEETLGEEKTLREHLLEQLAIDLPSAADRLIGTHLIDMLDDAGYVRGDLSEVADALGCGVARVEAVLARLQRFDPPGIFARSLAECLAIQLRDRDRLDPAMQALLDNLKLLAQRDRVALMRVCGVDAEDLADMVAELRALNPKPAETFTRETAPPVTPDVLMRRGADGAWIVELNSDTLPRVLVNTHYYATVSKHAGTKEARDYLSECYQSANWLVKSLHQRATTILKVASEIVRQQEAFFAYGVEYLRPLVLRDIADAIGMHESTVSRVTANKYMATGRGIFELKYFFTSAIQAADGAAAHSAESVRHRIKTLIDAEPADEVLSDDRIVEILRGDGIDIARRTVAKYREALRIPSSVQRRREKALGL